MKVAIVQEHVDSGRGGAETSTLEMARHLSDLGLEITVVCAASDLPGREPQAPFRFHRVPEGRGSRLRRTVRFVQAASRYCRMEAFDIVHAVTPCFAADVYQPRGGTYIETVARSIALTRSALGRFARRLGRRFNRRQRFLLLLEQSLLTDKRPPHVACVSEYVRRQVESAFAIPAEHVRVVFNGVDWTDGTPEQAAEQRAAFRRQIELADDTPLVLFVAHNFKLKGLAELLRATAGGASRWHVAVAGRDDPTRYRRLAARLGIRDRVAFVGTETPVENLYRAADVLAHPTWYDPCSRVVLEALAAGLPVVTTQFNGAAEVMERGRHGVVIDSPVEIEALARAISECLQPALREACRADADRLRPRISMARHAAELCELYDTVLKTRHRARD